MKIFLIDDKKVRQQSDYKWTDERFHKFKDLIERHQINKNNRKYKSSVLIYVENKFYFNIFYLN